MLRLYGVKVSGNVYKVKLLLSLLGLDYEEVHVDLMKGEHKQLDFLALNPFGQVPVLTDGDLISLDPYPHVLAWIERIKQLPNFVGMPGIDSDS